MRRQHLKYLFSILLVGVFYVYSNNSSILLSGDFGNGDESPGNPNTINARTDCTLRAAENSRTVIDVLNSENEFEQGVSEMIDELRMLAILSPVEHGLAVQIDSHPVLDDEFRVLNIGDRDNPQFINSGTRYEVEFYIDDNTFLIVHTHPEGTVAAPSPQDAISLANAFRDGATDIVANVVFAAGGETYMVFVNDRDALMDFTSVMENQDFFERDGGLFQRNSIWAQDYERVRDRLLIQGLSENDAQSFALSYVLYTHNTGLKVYRKGADGEFKEQRTINFDNNYIPKRCP